MSTIGFECQTRTHLLSSRFRKICVLAAIVASCGSWLGVEIKAQTVVKSTEETAVNTPRTDNPEEQVDVDYHETNLIPMTPAAPLRSYRFTR